MPIPQWISLFSRCVARNWSHRSDAAKGRPQYRGNAEIWHPDSRLDFSLNGKKGLGFASFLKRAPRLCKDIWPLTSFKARRGSHWVPFHQLHSLNRTILRFFKTKNYLTAYHIGALFSVRSSVSFLNQKSIRRIKAGRILNTRRWQEEAPLIFERKADKICDKSCMNSIASLIRK